MPATTKNLVSYRGSGIADPIDVRLGTLVRELRIERGLSQQQLGDAIGLTFQQVQKYERGTNRISVATLLRICRFLTVTPGQLVDQLSDLPTEGPDQPTDRQALVGAREMLNLRSEPVRDAIVGLLRAIAAPAE